MIFLFNAQSIAQALTFFAT